MLILTLIPYFGYGGVNSSQVADFPFQSQDGLIWLKVKIAQSTNSFRFLLDSGAGVSVIDLRVVQSLGLKHGNRVNVRGVGTVARGCWPQPLDATAGEIKLPTNYLALDLANLSRAGTAEIDGLLGADFFAAHVVQIDYKLQTICLLNSFTPDAKAEIVPLELRSCGMRVPVQVNGGGRLWMRLDTGCATPLQWVTSQIAFESCSQQPSIGMDLLSIPMTHTTVHFGQSDFIAVPTGLHEKAIFPGEAGLLGNGLLSRFARVTVDAAKGQLILEKKAFPD